MGRQPAGDEAESAQARAGHLQCLRAGHLHIGVKYLPQVADEGSRRYLFAAIGRATRWIGVAYLSGAGRGQCKEVVSRDPERATPKKIARVLADNGKAFADRLPGLRKCSPVERHEFDLLCAGLGIEHCLVPPMRPLSRSASRHGPRHRPEGRAEGSSAAASGTFCGAAASTAVKTSAR